jgi:hypothetical protein
MRKLLIILLSMELVIAILCGQLGFLHRRDFDRAFVAWYHNRTIENQAELDRRKRLNELSRWEFSGIVFGGTATITLLGAGVYRHLRRRAVH